MGEEKDNRKKYMQRIERKIDDKKIREYSTLIQICRNLGEFKQELRYFITRYIIIFE